MVQVLLPGLDRDVDAQVVLDVLDLEQDVLGPALRGGRVFGVEEGRQGRLVAEQVVELLHEGVGRVHLTYVVVGRCLGRLVAVELRGV